MSPAAQISIVCFLDLHGHAEPLQRATPPRLRESGRELIVSRGELSPKSFCTSSISADNGGATRTGARIDGTAHRGTPAAPRPDAWSALLQIAGCASIDADGARGSGIPRWSASPDHTPAAQAR